MTETSVKLERGVVVTIKVNGHPVQGKYLQPSTTIHNAHEVEYGGKVYHRKIRPASQVSSAVISEVVHDHEEHATTEVTMRAQIRTFDINVRFMFLEKMVDMVLTGPSCSLVICGDGGLGKSFMVKQRLAANHFKEGEDFVIIKGKATPKSIYRCLHENKDKVIIFDDCDSAFGNLDSVNVLKAALETDPTEPRRVSWLTEGGRADDELPNNFIFQGKIILLSNLYLHQLPQPLLSRSLHVDVMMSAAEKISRLRTIAPDIKPGVAMDVKTEVLDLMATIKDETKDLNVRTFLKAIDIRISQPEIWRDMVTYVLTSSR